MARSAQDKLSKIQARRERARKMEEQANEEFERLIQPLKKKLLTVADAAADTFVREHVEEMDSLSLTKKEQAELEMRLGEIFAETLRTAGRESGPDDTGEKVASAREANGTEKQEEALPQASEEDESLSREVGQDEL